MLELSNTQAVGMLLVRGSLQIEIEEMLLKKTWQHKLTNRGTINFITG